jgi:hypothetical protein
LPLAFLSLLASLVAVIVLESAGIGSSEQIGMLAAAIGLFAATNSAQRADRDHFVRASSWARWPFFLLLAVIFLQLLPARLSIAHPIWKSVHDALGTAFGYVTADVGLTVKTFFLALGATALTVTAILVARDRVRAELLLLLLSGISVLGAILLGLGHSSPSSIGDISRGFVGTLSGFGLMLNLAVMQLAAERAETRHAIWRSVAIGAYGLVGALISVVLLLSFASAKAPLAAGFGFVLFLLVLLIRRLDLSTIAATALSISALVGGAIILTFVFEKSSGSALLRLAADLPDATKVTLERMLADTRWLGAGAGTSASLARIYLSDGPEWTAPSAAIAVFIDAGWIGLSLAVAASIALVLRLFFASLSRGRDSFFPAASAGCVCFSLIDAFAGPGLLQPAGFLCLAVIVGLGLAQSVSATARSLP